jgi:hypothetical protein
MPKATIKTKSGTEIVIESDRKTINEIVMTFQRREEMLERFREASQNKRAGNIQGKKEHPSATDMILRLKQEGFFKEKKAIGEKQEELEKRGYHHPQTSLSGVLLRLLRKGELIRIREEKGWEYIQR